LRDGYGAVRSVSAVSAARNLLFSTSSQFRSRTPSSSMRLLAAGIEPGVRPPISAW